MRVFGPCIEVQVAHDWRCGILKYEKEKKLMIDRGA
jgi:hypothetical protein